ncbi:methyl-accepting chemotaxis protein II, partial [Yersinia pestis PY-46]
MTASISKLANPLRYMGKVAALSKTIFIIVTNGAIVIHTQRLKSDPGGN